MKKNHNRPNRQNTQNATPNMQSNGDDTKRKVDEEQVAKIVERIHENADKRKKEMFDKFNEYRKAHGQPTQEPHLTPAEKAKLENSKSEKDLESEETNMINPELDPSNIPGAESTEGTPNPLDSIPNTNPNANKQVNTEGDESKERFKINGSDDDQENKASDKAGDKEKKPPKTSVLIEDTGAAVMKSIIDENDPNLAKDNTRRKLVGDYLHENVKLVQFITKKGFGYSITAGKSTDSATQKTGYRTRVAMVKPAAKPMYAVLSLPAFVKEELVKIVNNAKVDVNSFNSLDNQLAGKVYNVQRMANPDVQFDGCNEAVIAEYAESYDTNKKDNPESVKVNKSTSYITLPYDMFCYLLTTVMDGDILEATEIKPDAVKKFVKRKEAKEGEEKPVDINNPQDFKIVTTGDGSESNAAPGYHAVRPSELDMGLFLRFYDDTFAGPVNSALTANNALDKKDSARKSATKVITDTVNKILFSNPEVTKKEDLRLSENGDKIAAFLADMLQTDAKKEAETGITRQDEAATYLKKMDFAKVVRQCRAYIDGTAVVIRDKGAFNKLYTDRNFTPVQRVSTKKIFLDNVAEDTAISVCAKAYSTLNTKGGDAGENRIAGDMKLWKGKTLEVLTQNDLSGVEKYRKLTDMNYSDGSNVADGAKQMSAKEIDAAYEPKKDFAFKDFYTGAPILPSNAGGIEVYSYINTTRNKKVGDTQTQEPIVKLPARTLTTGEITSENEDKVYHADDKTKKNFLLFSDLKQSSGVLDDILSQISKKGRKSTGSSKAPAQKKKAANRDTVRQFRFAKLQADKANSNYAPVDGDNIVI